MGYSLLMKQSIRDTYHLTFKANIKFAEKFKSKIKIKKVNPTFQYNVKNILTKYNLWWDIKSVIIPQKQNLVKVECFKKGRDIVH